MKKNRLKAKWLPWVIGWSICIVTYLLLSLLTANLILQGTIPESAGPVGLCLAAAISSFLMGTISGKRELWFVTGLAAGCAAAFGILIVKGICAENAVWTVYTSAATASCVLFSILGSCIFHKRNKKSAKSKRKTTR